MTGVQTCALPIYWRKKQVEAYMLTPDETSVDDAEYKLFSVITEENKADLKIRMFPNIKIDFDDLFDGI